MSTILIAEDEEPLRVLAEPILIDAGHTVLTAANATEALAILRSAESVDVLFTDLNMGETHGLDLAIAAREHQPELKVLYTVALVLPTARVRVLCRCRGFCPNLTNFPTLLSLLVR